MADPDHEFATAFNVNLEGTTTKDVLTHVIPQTISCKIDGFSQEIHKPSEFHGKSNFLKPAMFIIRNGGILHSWRPNYGDHCPELVRDITLILDLKSNSDDTNDEVDEDGVEENVKNIESGILENNEKKEVIIEEDLKQEEVIVNIDGNKSESTVTEIVTIDQQDEKPTQPTIQQQDPSQEPEEQLTSTFPTVAKKATRTSTLFKHVNLHDFTNTQDVPRYRKVKSSSTLEIITPEMKLKEEIEKTRKAKRLIAKRESSTKLSCFGATSTEILSHNIDVMNVLENPKYRKYFKAFAHEEYNCENVMFWEDVQLYKGIMKSGNTTSSAPSQRRVRKAKRIADQIGNQYLFDSYSIFHINTTDRLRDKVKDAIEMAYNTTPLNVADANGVFDSVVDEMFSSMLQDMFMRFKISKLFNEMLIE